MPQLLSHEVLLVPQLLLHLAYLLVVNFDTLFATIVNRDQIGVDLGLKLKVRIQLANHGQLVVELGLKSLVNVKVLLLFVHLLEVFESTVL